MCTAMLVGQMGMTVYAEENRQQPGGGMRTPPEHTEECGYVEAVKGHRCEHVHGRLLHGRTDCGYDDEDMDLADSSATHVHKKCYELDCPISAGVYDDDCGYIEAVKATPAALSVMYVARMIRMRIVNVLPK